VRQNLAMASSDPSSDGDEREVFAGLPNARAHRRSAKRDRPARGGARTAAAQTKPATTKPKAKQAAPKAKRAAAQPKPAAKVPPAGYATPVADDDAPKGAELVGTAVRAAGELAQIGIAFGGRALKSAIERLPRP
jgi:hypothetical protein